MKAVRLLDFSPLFDHEDYTKVSCFQKATLFLSPKDDGRSMLKC